MRYASFGSHRFGSAGDRATADWIAAELKAAGALAQCEPTLPLPGEGEEEYAAAIDANLQGELSHQIDRLVIAQRCSRLCAEEQGDWDRAEEQGKVMLKAVQLRLCRSTDAAYCE